MSAKVPDLVDLGLRYRTDDATSINGNSYVRDFPYWRSHAGLTFVWKASKADRFKVAGEFAQGLRGDLGAQLARLVEWGL